MNRNNIVIHNQQHDIYIYVDTYIYIYLCIFVYMGIYWVWSSIQCSPNIIGIPKELGESTPAFDKGTYIGWEHAKTDNGSQIVASDNAQNIGLLLVDIIMDCG